MINVGQTIAAIGALGTASFGLADATKAFGGGVSRAGLKYIRAAIAPLFGSDARLTDRSSATALGSVLGNLKANWINGTSLADQKAIAKSLVKLRLSPTTAAPMAHVTGVDAAELTAIAAAINAGTHLTPAQADVFGRFDLALTSILDEGYQAADQRYRNCAKLLAGAFAVVIAVLAGALMSSPDFQVGTLRGGAAGGGSLPYWGTSNMWLAFLCGVLATPLAPVAKDITSAIAAGVGVVQRIQGRK